MTDIRALHALDSADLERLIDAMENQRDETARGDRGGYGQDYRTEMDEISALLSKLRAAR